MLSLLGVKGLINKEPIVDRFLGTYHLFDLQYILSERRNYFLVTPGCEIVKIVNPLTPRSD